MLMLALLGLLLLVIKSSVATTFALVATLMGGEAREAPVVSVDSPDAWVAAKRCPERTGAARGWLGVATITAADTLDSVTPEAGLLVTRVVDDTAAERARLLPGDRLVRVDGTALTSPFQLRTIIRAHRPGDVVELAWMSKGELHTAAVALGALSRK